MVRMTPVYMVRYLRLSKNSLDHKLPVDILNIIGDFLENKKNSDLLNLTGSNHNMLLTFNNRLNKFKKRRICQKTAS